MRDIAGVSRRFSWYRYQVESLLLDVPEHCMNKFEPVWRRMLLWPAAQAEGARGRRKPPEPCSTEASRSAEIFDRVGPAISRVGREDVLRGRVSGINVQGSPLAVQGCHRRCQGHPEFRRLWGFGTAGPRPFLPSAGSKVSAISQRGADLPPRRTEPRIRRPQHRFGPYNRTQLSFCRVWSQENVRRKIKYRRI